MRSPDDSTVHMSEIVLPEDTNPRGSIFGGRLLALIDKCAAIAAIRHARCDAVTVSVDSVTFVNAVRLGDILLLRGRLNAAFSSSMEVEVEVFAEEPLTGARRVTTTAFVTMVAVDAAGRPRPVPRLQLVDEDARRREREATERRRRRLESRRPGP
jgi:acyl-CoA hydrolase